MALQLRRRGITRVHPLLGGLEAWREKGFPLEQKLVQLPEADAPTERATETA